MQKDYLVPVSILVAGVVIAGAVIYATGLQGTSGTPQSLNQNQGLQVSLELTSDDVILGDPKAPVTLIEYADFQCPYCGRFHLQAESLIKENFVKTGKVKMVYRHFAFLGPESTASAEAVECAKDQGKFWEFHDALYEAEMNDGQEHNGNLDNTLFKSLASKLGLNQDALTSCISSKKYANKVKKDYDSAIAAGVGSTPTIFLNGHKVEGALPYAQFETLINGLLSS